MKRKTLLALGLLFVIVAIPITINLSQHPQDLRQRAKETPTQDLTTSKTELLNQARTYRGQAANKDIAAVKAVAIRRKALLLEELKKSPRAFVAAALTDQERNQLPEELINAGLVEKPVKIKGDFQEIVFEDFAGRTSKTSHALIQDAKLPTQIAYNLYFTDTAPTIPAGSTISVDGIQLDQEVVVATDQPNQAYQVLALPLTPVEQQTAVIMFNFLNDRSEPYTAARLREIMFTDPRSVNTYYQENSYNQISFGGEVFGYFTIPYEKNTSAGCIYWEWATAADSQAYAAGIPIQNYSRRVYAFPSVNGCPGGAWATVGGDPSRAWMPGVHEISTFAHEIGHTLGRYHANSLSCAPNIIGDFTQGLSDCYPSEYGDVSDTMGQSYYYNQFNSFHKTESGWLTDADAVEIQTSGTYALGTLENSTTIPRAYKIQVPNSYFHYFLGYRQPLGFDSNLPSGLTQGAQIHLGNIVWGSGTYLLDMHPESASPSGYNSFENAAMLDGESFVDAANGITITQVSHTNDQAILDVTLDESVCRHHTPDVVFTPPTQSGNINQTLNYTATITNNDTTNCPPTEFNWYAYHQDWTVQYSPASAFINPGQQASISLQVTSAYNTALGPHQITFGLSSQYPRHSLNDYFEYVVLGTIGRIDIQPTSITTPAGTITNLSALAYDIYNRPLWNGVTYDWGISSTNTIGTLSPNFNIAQFTALNIGTGDIFINATYNGETVTNSIPVTVTSSLPSTTPQPSPTISVDFNHDGLINGDDVRLLLFGWIDTLVPFDVNADNKVNTLDFSEVIRQLAN